MRRRWHSVGSMRYSIQSVGSCATSYLVSLMGSGGSNLALLARRKFGEIAVIIALPVSTSWSAPDNGKLTGKQCIHLVIEDLRLSGLCLGNQVLIENVQNILADLLKLGLDLLAIVADSSNMLICTLGLLFLLDRRDNAPRGTSGSNDVLVGHGQKVSFINCKLATDLEE